MKVWGRKRKNGAQELGEKSACGAMGTVYREAIPSNAGGAFWKIGQGDLELI